LIKTGILHQFESTLSQC